MVASPSRDLLRREASSSSGICDSDRRRVSCTSSRPPVESVAEELLWGPEQKHILLLRLGSGYLQKCILHVKEYKLHGVESLFRN